MDPTGQTGLFFSLGGQKIFLWSWTGQLNPLYDSLVEKQYFSYFKNKNVYAKKIFSFCIKFLTWIKCLFLFCKENSLLFLKYWENASKNVKSIAYLLKFILLWFCILRPWFTQRFLLYQHFSLWITKKHYSLNLNQLEFLIILISDKLFALQSFLTDN